MLFNEITQLLKTNGCTCEWMVSKSRITDSGELPGAVLEFWKTSGGRKFMLELSAAGRLDCYLLEQHAGDTTESVFSFLQGFTGHPAAAAPPAQDFALIPECSCCHAVDPVGGVAEYQGTHLCKVCSSSRIGSIHVFNPLNAAPTLYAQGFTTNLILAELEKIKAAVCPR